MGRKKEDVKIKEYEMSIFFKAIENKLQVVSLLLSPSKENKPKYLLGLVVNFKPYLKTAKKHTGANLGHGQWSFSPTD